MPSELETLVALRASLVAKLAELTSNPKPSYSIDGQSVDWQGFYDSLWKQLRDAQEQIVRMEGPFELHSRGIA